MDGAVADGAVAPDEVAQVVGGVRPPPQQVIDALQDRTVQNDVHSDYLAAAGAALHLYLSSPKCLRMMSSISPARMRHVSTASVVTSKSRSWHHMDGSRRDSTNTVGKGRCFFSVRSSLLTMTVISSRSCLVSCMVSPPAVRGRARGRLAATSAGRLRGGQVPNRG